MTSESSVHAKPQPNLSVFEAVAMMVGIVVGIGIFKAPQLVALNLDSGWAFMAAWCVGGLVTLIGALVYAELGSAHPDTGGEYHFLRKAFGHHLALLFAWARLTVIQTGAIAVVAFVYGDYAQRLLPLGEWGASIHAALAILLFTLVNLYGSAQSSRLQLVFTIATIAGLIVIVLLGLAGPAAPAAPPPAAAPGGGSVGAGAAGLAMVFILLTYGGWNETAYLSAELRDGRRNMARVLVLGCGTIFVLYFLVNLTYLRVLGLEGVRASDAVGADTMAALLGSGGATALVLGVCFAALSTLNATIFTGARLYYSIGRDLPLLRRIGYWDSQRNTPLAAVLAQSLIALLLVGLGTGTRSGFQTIVEYTAPVFWFFLLLVGVSLFVLRRQASGADATAFRVPLYPLTPLLFCLTCAYLLYSSIAYAGTGSLVGVAVLLLGLPLLLLNRAPKLAAGG